MKWTCKNGKVINIRDMTDDHLRNSIRLLRRCAPRMLDSEIQNGWAVLGSLQGEMAQYYCEQEVDNLSKENPQDWIENNPKMAALLKELKKRKLKELDYENT